MEIINSAVAIAATLLGLVTASVLHNDNSSQATERVVLVQHRQLANRSIDVILSFVVRTQPAPISSGMPVR
jgi:hypothetical protein